MKKGTQMYKRKQAVCLHFKNHIFVFLFTGILGLWSGLVPRLLGEAITIGLTAGLTYFINQYVDNNMKAHTTTFAG